MLNQQTIEKLHAMRMRGMADGIYPAAGRTAKPLSSVSRSASPCWWTVNGTGARTGHWNGGSKRPTARPGLLRRYRFPRGAGTR